jgi:hypothetical protein
LISVSSERERAMQSPLPLQACPQCGAGSRPESPGCPACGALLLACLEEGWEQPLVERGRGFRLGAVGETLLSLALRPERSFARFRWDGGYLAPLTFALLLAGPALGLGHALEVYLATGTLGGVAGGRLLALVLLGPPLYLYLRAHLVHLALVLLGAARRSYEATFRAVAYSNASVALLWLVPAGGSFIFLVWGAVLEITALRAAHRLPLGKASLAVVLPTCAMWAALLGRAGLDLLFQRQFG